MKHRFLKAISILVASIFLLTACGGDGGKTDPTKNDKMADLTAHYGLSEGEALIVINGVVSEVHAKKIDGRYFIPASLASKINSCLYFNQTEEQAMYTDGAGISYYYPDLTYKIVNGEQVDLGGKVLTFGADSQMYVDINLTGAEYKIEENPARIVIWTNVEGKNYYTVNANKTALRTNGDDVYEVISYLNANECVIVTSAESNGYIGVTTESGLSGYVKVDGITFTDAPTASAASAKANAVKLSGNYPETGIKFGENLLCVWHNMEYSADGSLLTGELKGDEGVDVVIPTWYQVSAVDGSIRSYANADYVQTAHNMGYKVLGLVNDFAPDVKGIEFLSNTNSRKNFINNIVTSANESGLDGINIDFEYITSSSAPHYVQLLRELYLETKKNGLALTVCIYVPDNSNSFYNYNALAKICDYIFVMTYDEHTNVDNIGPVASIDFVKNGVSSALKYVPKDKLLMGIPLYTRLWLDDGLGNMSVQVLTYKTQMNTIEARGLSPEWKEEDGYNYVEYRSDAGYGKMWIEDEKSLGLKKNVAVENGIAGVSCWCLGYQNSSVWNILK